MHRGLRLPKVSSSLSASPCLPSIIPVIIIIVFLFSLLGFLVKIQGPRGGVTFDGSRGEEARFQVFGGECVGGVAQTFETDDSIDGSPVYEDQDAGEDFDVELRDEEGGVFDVDLEESGVGVFGG